MKVFYHLDNDGKCAGFWVRKLATHTDNYPLEFYRINYDEAFPLDIIQPDEQVYIVDFSIMPEQMDKLLEITENVTWVDHHKSAIERYANYDKEIKGLRYDGIAGCMLTYCYLNHMTDGGEGEIRPFNESMTDDAPMFTKLIADYDVWKFEYGTKTREFTFGFEIYNSEPVDSIWNEFIGDIDDELLDRIINQGKTIIAYRAKFTAEYCEEKGFEGELDGNSFFALNLAKIDSHDYDSIDTEKYDLLIGFSFNGSEWAYSLRSTKVDCAEVAMKYGGGGHKGAAGFSTKELLLHKKEESFIESLISTMKKARMMLKEESVNI